MMVIKFPVISARLLEIQNLEVIPQNTMEIPIIATGQMGVEEHGSNLMQDLIPAKTQMHNIIIEIRT